jgi:hypothetical protein
LSDPSKFGIVKHSTTGIVRRIHNNHPRSRCQPASENLCREPKTLGFMGPHKNWIGVHKARNIAESHPVRRRNDHVIPFLNNSCKNVEERVFASEVHNALGNVIFRIEISRVFVDHRFFKLFYSTDCSVLCEICLDGADGCALNIFGRWKVRLPGSEVNDINSLISQFDRRFHYGHRL